METEKYIVLSHLVNNSIEVAYHDEDGLPCVYDTIEEAESEMEDFGNDEDDFIGRVVIIDNTYHIYNLEGNQYYFTVKSATKETLCHAIPSSIKTLVAELMKYHLQLKR